VFKIEQRGVAEYDCLVTDAVADPCGIQKTMRPQRTSPRGGRFFVQRTNEGSPVGWRQAVPTGPPNTVKEYR
jgi:hypothetical protein